MQVKIADSWKNILQSEFKKTYFKNLMDFVTDEYENNICYPPKNQIFAAFNYCDFTAVKVVIIGQDPYHGANQANGLCFSVQDDVKHPPSLKNIFKELNVDIGKEIPVSGNLSHWAKQGVLLLNATLTVKEKSPNSHKKSGWNQFTDAVIQLISDKKEGVVFLLWGGFAKQKGKKIDTNKHKVFAFGHPSPMSANRGHWFGNKHFSKTNTYLKSVGKKPIVW